MKKTGIPFFGLLSLLMLFPSCSWWESKEKKDESTVTHQDGSIKLRLVNVLDQIIFDDAHIKGGPGVESLCVPFEEVNQKAQAWDKTIPVVVYCSNYFCTASGLAARSLKKMGFEKVWAYEGGMAEWFQLSKKDPAYQVEGPGKLSYLGVVVANPMHNPEDVQIITSEDLQKMIKHATLST